jgi:excinuclease ABC subunit C
MASNLSEHEKDSSFPSSNEISEEADKVSTYSSESQNKLPLYYELPDGERVYYQTGPTAEAPIGEDAERDFSASIFDDINLAPLQHGFTLTPSTEEDYVAIANSYRKAAEKAKDFPMEPGVYLMKDGQGRVIYIGKAKRLRNRVNSYFRREAIDDQRVGPLVREIRDIDYLPAESEIDALLMEARLIKDVQPKYNRSLKDDKSFPYLQITTREDFPRVEATRAPKSSSVRLYGPFLSSGHLRSAIVVLQKIFKFRTCSMKIDAADQERQWNRPCVLASIGQCSAPCCDRISQDAYRRNIRRLQEFLGGDRQRLLKEIKDDMLEASDARRYELAAEYRDQLTALESLKERGNIEDNVQPEVFQIDPRRGVIGLQKVFKLPKPPRVIEGIDIAHLGGQDTVASLVYFVDGRPFKNGYRRYKIKSVHGVDDFASIAEVVSRRFAFSDPNNPPPDILLIDGGKGQLYAALKALESAACRPELTISLAKREEEIYIPDQDEPLKLSRRSFALRLLQSVRDEAHRFAQHYHHMLRRKSTFGNNREQN